MQDLWQFHDQILLIISLKKCKKLNVKIKCKSLNVSHFFIEYKSVKENLIKYKCLPCNKDYSSKTDKPLKEKFRNTFKFSDNDVNKFILLFILTNMWMNGKSLI